jgi:hypothetical protein
VDLCYNNCALCEISQTVQLSQDWIIKDFLFLKYLVVLFLQLCHAVSRIVKCFSSIFYADCFVGLFKYLVSLVYLYLCMYSGGGGHGSAVVKLLRYKSEGRWFHSHWRYWNFSLTQSFRSHYGPGVADSASNRNDYQEHFLGVKAAGA